MILYYLLRIIGHLPFFVTYFISDLLFFISYYIIHYRKKVVYENLKIAFPELRESVRRQIAKKFYHNLCDIILETIKVQSMKRSDFTERVKIRHKEIIQEYLNQGRPVLAIVGHVGNHEWEGIASGIQYGCSTDTIYKPLKDAYIDKLVKNIRSRFGNHLIPMKDTFREILKRKNIIRMIAVAGDQTPPKDEIEYRKTFFGRETPFYIGAQTLAEFGKYPVIFCYMRKIRKGYYELVIEKLAEPPYEGNNTRIIDLFVERLEQVIRQYPDSWLWSHRKWKHG